MCRGRLEMVAGSRKKAMKKNPYQEQTDTKHAGGLPPLVGKLGSIAFFATLFALADTDARGYEIFRKCHGNCVNGILHFIGMPLAVSGVFLIVRSASDSPTFTRIVQGIVTSRYLYLYLQFETNPYSPWIFFFLYMAIFDGYLYHYIYQNPTWGRLQHLLVGALLIGINVGALEVIGHGIFEQHHSYVLEFFNSVFHTPLYGVNSVMTTFSPRSDHACW